MTPFLSVSFFFIGGPSAENNTFKTLRVGKATIVLLPPSI